MDAIPPEERAAIETCCIPIDPDGDLILINCPSGSSLPNSYRVSKKALCLASPVLTEMLKPPSLGGCVQESKPWGTDRLVLLQQYDCVALLLFLCVIHHKHTPAPGHRMPHLLHHLACLIYNYQCPTAFVGRAQQWLPDRYVSWEAEELWLALEFAYVLGLKEKFRIISRALVTAGPDSYGIWAYGGLNGGLLPVDMRDRLDDARTLAAPNIKGAILNTGMRLAKTRCENAGAFIFQHVMALQRVGLMHDLQGVMRTANFNYIYSKAKRLEIAIYQPDAGCACNVLRGHEQRENMVQGLDRCYAHLGLCLVCVRDGKEQCPEHSTTGSLAPGDLSGLTLSEI